MDILFLFVPMSVVLALLVIAPSGARPLLSRLPRGKAHVRTPLIVRNPAGQLLGQDWFVS